MMINNAALNTYIQSWSRCLVCLFSVCLVFLHCLAFIFGVLYAPDMSHHTELLGAMCREGDLYSATWYEEESSSHGGCSPVTLFEEVDSLEELTFSFRFPSEETKPSFYSVWNWRLLGNLLLEVTFDESEIEEFKSLDHNTTSDNAYGVKDETIIVTLVAHLDVAPIKQNPEPILFGPDGSESGNQTDEDQFYGSWTRKAELVAERKLQCTSSKNIDSPNDDENSSQISYVCTLSPLFDIQLVNNQSHIISFRFQQYTHYHNSDFNETSNANVNDTVQFTNQTESQSRFLTSRVLVNELSVTLITENAKFHRGIFVIKCLFTPFVIAALLLFCVRMYLNDLYISIPDRLLITVALAQIVENFPTEILLNSLPDWSNMVYLKLLDDFGQVFLMIAMLLFWIVYTKDKLAKNEPWERNTRYYWKQIILVCLGAITAALYITFTQGPALRNPFNNHWQPGTTAVYVSLGFIFGLATLAMTAQTYLSVLIFRVLCDVSVVVIYQGSSLRGGIWRLKMVLVYCLAVSSLTVGSFILRLAIHLSLNWNPQFYLDPIPFHLSYASVFFLGIQGLWNLHTISLLIMLSRGPGGLHEYIKPIKYMETGSTDQYELQMLHEHVVPVPLAIRRRNPQQNQRRPSSEDFLEAMESKRNGIIRNGDHYFNSNNQCDTYDSDVPDPGRSESSFASDTPGMDSPDMLESLRRETVHLWEMSDNRSEPILELAVEDDDDDDDMQRLADQVCYGQQRPKIVSSTGRYER